MGLGTTTVCSELHQLPAFQTSVTDFTRDLVWKRKPTHPNRLSPVIGSYNSLTNECSNVNLKKTQRHCPTQEPFQLDFDVPLGSPKQPENNSQPESPHKKPFTSPFSSSQHTVLRHPLGHCTDAVPLPNRNQTESIPAFWVFRKAENPIFLA